jgi:hypothetical protein
VGGAARDGAADDGAARGEPGGAWAVREGAAAGEPDGACPAREESARFESAHEETLAGQNDSDPCADETCRQYQ